MTELEVAPRRRPRDRKERILEFASELFLARGFPAVTMEDIAEAAGVTPRALYRHYDNKSDLLARVIMSSQDWYLSARAEAGVTVEIGRALSADLNGLIDVALATRHLTVLWQREARHLPDEQRREVRGRITTIVAGIRDGIAAERPALDDPHLWVRAWGVSSTLTSLGFHALSLPREEMRRLIADACRAAADTAPAACLQPRPEPAVPVAVSVGLSRRELLLEVGADAFARHGFVPVGISEIGRRASIAGPGIYRYFPSKQAILDTLAGRLDEWRNLEHLRALRAGGTADAVLRRLVVGYLTISMENPALVAVSTTEGDCLSADVREAVARSIADRDGAWLDCVRGLAPGLSRSEARILVLAARAFIDDIARTPSLCRLTGVESEVADVALAILRSPRAGGGAA